MDASAPRPRRRADRSRDGAGFSGRQRRVPAGGADFATADDPVEVLVPAGTRWRPVRASASASSPPTRTSSRTGTAWRVTGRVRTAVDLIRRGGAEDAVILLDRLCDDGMVRLDDVRAAVADAPAMPGQRAGAAGGRARRRPGGVTAGDAAAAAPRTGPDCPRRSRSSASFDEDGLHRPRRFRLPGAASSRSSTTGAWHGRPGQFAQGPQSAQPTVRRRAGASCFVTAADMHDPSELVAPNHAGPRSLITT